MFYFSKTTISGLSVKLQASPIVRGFSSVFLCLATLHLIVASLNFAQARTPVSSYVIINAKNGLVIAESKSNVVTYPASLTKVMTLMLVFDALDKGLLKLDQKLLISHRASIMPATKVGLKAGDTITVEDAIQALIIHSANDAAVVIAENLADSEASFVRLMNEKAKKIGLIQTTFGNASGLPHFKQVTTAADMGRLSLTLIREYPEYYRYFSKKSFTYHNRQFFTHNSLLKEYDGADGLKTGYIRASGYNLITSAQRGNNRLVVVVMGARSSALRTKQMIRLLNMGFKEINKPLTQQSALFAPTNRQPVRNSKPLPNPASLKPALKPSVAIYAEPSGKEKSWGIQIGAFATYNLAQDELNQAITVLRQSSYGQANITVYQAGKGKTFYRARLLGLTNQKAAEACKLLVKKTFSCFLVKNVPATAERH